MVLGGGVRGVGESLVVEVVQQPHEAPGLRVLSVLRGIGAHRRTGPDKPRFLRPITSSGTSPRAASFNIALVVKPRTLRAEGAGSTSSITSRSRNGARASMDASIVPRSTFTRRLSGR